MSNNRLGDQIVTWDFKNVATGEGFNKHLRGILKPGFYKGGVCTNVGNDITIPVFNVILNVGTDKIIQVTTSSSITLTATSPNDILYMTYTYLEVEENWLDFAWRSSLDAPVANEVIICKVTYSGLNVSTVDNSVRTLGTFDSNYNMYVDGTLLVTANPTLPYHVGNVEFNDDRYMSIDYNEIELGSLRTRMQLMEQQILENLMTINYLTQRVSNSSNWFSEQFFNEDSTSEESYLSSPPAEVMDDNDWNNNWIKTNGTPEFKNGFLRPKKQPYMMEVTDEFQLEGVGQLYKCSMDYDSTNECYWMISNAGDNGIGEISKLALKMENGSVQVLSRWYLPAGGASTQWSGICTDGSFIYFSLWKSASSVVYKISINADGTLGATSYTKTNGETLDLVNSVAWNAADATAASYITDLISYSVTEIAYLLCNTTTVSLKFMAKSNGGAGTTTTITGLGNFIGGGDSFGRSITKSGNDIYLRVNNITTSDLRIIYKFDIATCTASNVLIKTTGRFTTIRPDTDREATANEGICVSDFGDILEIVSTTSNGKFISKHEVTNSLWSENQINGVHRMNASTNPSASYACMVDSIGNFWTADTGAGATNVDLYRFDTDGSKHSCRLEGVTRNWTALWDLTTDGTSVWMLGWDGTNYEVIKGSLSALNAVMDLVSDYDALNALDIDTWGTLWGNGAAITKALYGICYDSDNNILYLLNDTDDKIGTMAISDGASATLTTYDLPAPTNTWRGIAYLNGNIYVGDYTNDTQPNRIYVLPLSKQTASAWYRSHIYQDPSLAFTANGRTGFDFNEDDLVCTHYDSLTFLKMKILEDDDTLQKHSFIDANNILLSNNVTCATSITERFFDPEDFFDIRDCPDNFYMCVGYGDEGFTELHLDEYLSGKSATGKDRYDVAKIRTRHYKRGANNLFLNANVFVNSISIERDIIFVSSAGDSVTAYGKVFVVNLKSGKASYLTSSSAIVKSGYYYNGNLTQRNDGLATTGSYNAELDLVITATTAKVNKIHAYTFTKNDSSDYNNLNPTTFVTIGTDSGNDVLRIDWDSNNNCTLVKVWNKIGNVATYGQHSGWIAPSGTLFLARYATTGNVYKTNVPVWEITSDNTTAVTEIGSSITAGYGLSISPNSRCWKTPSGVWRHQLIIGTYSGAGTTIFMRACVVDVENVTMEYTTSVDLADYQLAVDTFEDIIFTTQELTTPTTHNLHIYKKLRFNDKFFTIAGYNYTRIKSLGNTDRPYFTAWKAALSGTSKVCQYSSNHGILAAGSSLTGLQLLHFWKNIESSKQESTIQNCNNPSKYNYLQNINESTGQVVTKLDSDDASVVYTDGATATWGTSGIRKRIARDGVTEGYSTWSGITNANLAGINFILDNNAGGVKITVTDTTTSTILTNWNEKTINLFHAEGSTEIDYTCWITLPSLDHTYSIKCQHSGINNAGLDDYLTIENYFTIKNMTSGYVSTVLTSYNSSYPTHTYTYTLVEDVVTSLEKTYAFNGDDVTDTFVLPATVHASSFTEWSINGGTTWFKYNDALIDWGSNAPNYDDDTIDATGLFGVVFLTPPPTGVGNVLLKYVPMANKYYLTRTMHQPKNGVIIDNCATVRLLGDTLELI